MRKNKIRDSHFDYYLEKATTAYFEISRAYDILKRIGYTKTFTEFLNDIKARVTYRKILSKKV